MRTYKQTISAGIVGVIIGVSIATAGLVAADKEPAKKNALPIKEVQRFTSAISQIKSFYVKPISDQKLFDNAIRGMLEGLDPHSDYLDQEEFSELTSNTRGKFSGLGIEVTMEHGVIKVITPIDDSPAAKAGIKPGDLIISLDNTPVKGLSLRQAVNKMRGKQGTSITLTVIREGEKKPLKIDVTRNVVEIKSVKSELYSGGLGYIRISNFQVPTADDVSKAINKLKEQAHGKLHGIVLDLRNNPGGLLDSAIEVSDEFLDSNKLGANKSIVSTKGRVAGANFNANATPGDITNGLPMVVLINQGSASAAEIVAGALQDHNRGILVGSKSFGKGSVQTVLPLDQDTAVKLTTALYYTPSGRSIQAKGIVPDVAIVNFDMSKAKDKTNSLEMISEADLQGHLAKLGKDKKIDPKKLKMIKVEKNLVYTDYQLYEALNLLKGLVILQERPASVGQLAN